jgi:hypothetical protein
MKKTPVLLFLGMITNFTFAEEPSSKESAEDVQTDEVQDDDDTNPDEINGFSALSILNIEKAYAEEMKITENELISH